MNRLWAVRWGFRSWAFCRLADLGQKPHLTADPAAALNKGGRPKAAAPKVHIGFRLAAEIVESLKAGGPGYNVRVEEALRAAGFGAAKKAAAKCAPLAKRGRLIWTRDED